jgi:CDP-diacylglycerol--serine O-phosphatidyltransferase
MGTKQPSRLDDQNESNWGIIADIASIANGLVGISAIYTTFIGAFYLGVRFMSLGVLLDALDGYLARKMKLSGPRRRGIYLDSISDGITFGLFPAALYLACFKRTLLVVISAGIYVGAAWYRLARYTQAADVERFRGLPSPGGAAVTAAFLILFTPPTNIIIIFFVTIAILMASKIAYPSFKKPRGVEKYLQSGTGIVTGLFVILPESVGIYALSALFGLSIIYVLVGPFWIRSPKERMPFKRGTL